MLPNKGTSLVSLSKIVTKVSQGITWNKNKLEEIHSVISFFCGAILDIPKIGQSPLSVEEPRS